MFESNSNPNALIKLLESKELSRSRSVMMVTLLSLNFTVECPIPLLVLPA